MNKTIPFQRQLLYAVAIGLLPLLAAAFFAWGKKEQLQQRRKLLPSQAEAMVAKHQRTLPNAQVADTYRNADPYYIDKALEPLSFCKREIEELNALMPYQNFAPDEKVTRRREMLSSDKNRLAFMEGAVVKSSSFKETEESLHHPVEVDEEDLVKLLDKIERLPQGDNSSEEGRPQLIITDFSLTRKRGSHNETFLVDMKLIKREFRTS
ncbi:hypothetical protein JYU14_04315 [Simkania negevensis]|uniref:Uncharacterized protein n=1 Tax=Simkania negevensis TaxID=83561 RepID=A0ABS3ASB8_9BACT|nr:hypothetical protein [Simkania negevensis]